MVLRSSGDPKQTGLGTFIWHLSVDKVYKQLFLQMISLVDIVDFLSYLKVQERILAHLALRVREFQNNKR